MIGIFDAIQKLTALADDPAFAKTGEALVQGAREIPLLLKTICNQNGEAFRQNGKILETLERIHGTLVEISLGLDNLSDPIARPPFKPADLEAAMDGVWPPSGNDGQRAKTDLPLDCTNLVLPTLEDELRQNGGRLIHSQKWPTPSPLLAEYHQSIDELSKMQADAPSSVDGRR